MLKKLDPPPSTFVITARPKFSSNFVLFSKTILFPLSLIFNLQCVSFFVVGLLLVVLLIVIEFV